MKETKCKIDVFLDNGINFVLVNGNYKKNTLCGLSVFKPSSSSGNNSEWYYNEITNGLIYSGDGSTKDFADVINPWDNIKNEIKSISISGIESIGSNAFKDYINLENIIIGKTLNSEEEIDEIDKNIDYIFTEKRLENIDITQFLYSEIKKI
jgi:hypothetical protein